MADRFQNGLLLPTVTSNQCGRTFSRWLVEFATQICGWTWIDDSPGAGSYTNTQGTGTNGASVAGQVQRLDITGDAYNFTSADEGRYLTITSGMPAGFEDRHGIYRIAKFLTSKTVELDIYYSVHDAGIPHPSTGLNWRLWGPEATDVPGSAGTEWAVIQGTGTQQAATYNFQARMIQQTGDSQFPQFEVGPFAGWNTGTNSWDQPNTTAFDQWSAEYCDYSRVWAVGDSDRIVAFVRMLDNDLRWNMVYIGEIDAFYGEATDPNPVLVWNGNGGSGDLSNMFGVGNQGSGYMSGGGRMLGADDSTTVQAFANIFCTGATGNEHWVRSRIRRRSTRTRRTYRQSWIVESRTSTLQEHRGAMRRLWICPEEILRAKAFGRNGEYLHVWGGCTIPWNGSGQHEQRV
jgi:hypothetical protein